MRLQNGQQDFRELALPPRCYTPHVDLSLGSLLIARHSMSDVETRFLPLLPLSTGVVLPQMVVPLGLESDTAKAAADAALTGDGLLVLVPRIEADGEPTVYAKVGTVAKIEEAGRLPGGGRGVLVRGLHRAILGAAVPGFGEGSSADGLFVQVQPVEDPAGAPTERTRELMKEYRAVVE